MSISGEKMKLCRVDIEAQTIKDQLQIKLALI